MQVAQVVMLKQDGGCVCNQSINYVFLIKKNIIPLLHELFLGAIQCAGVDH